MSWAGRWWRAGGILLLTTTWWVAWETAGAFSKAGWMLLGLAIFAGFWFIAAWFDINQSCCTKTRPHIRQDYGVGQHWVDVQ